MSTSPGQFSWWNRLSNDGPQTWNLGQADVSVVLMSTQQMTGHVCKGQKCISLVLNIPNKGKKMDKQICVLWKRNNFVCCGKKMPLSLLLCS